MKQGQGYSQGPGNHLTGEDVGSPCAVLPPHTGSEWPEEGAVLTEPQKQEAGAGGRSGGGAGAGTVDKSLMGGRASGLRKGWSDAALSRLQANPREWDVEPHAAGGEGAGVTLTGESFAVCTTT